jgi:hypothetical protein
MIEVMIGNHILVDELLFIIWFFIVLYFLFFRSCFVPVFFSHVVSSLVYPNLLENKMLDCCCYCCLSINAEAY